MTRRAKKRSLIGVGVLAVLASSGWIALNPRTHDPFPFLAEHPVEHRSVMEPGSWPATDVRVYTWKEDWRNVAARARQELPHFGLNEEPEVEEGAAWESELVDGGPCGKNSELGVFITSGRALPLSYSNALTDKDPAWVTVLVHSWLDESWINVLRYTFFSMPE